VGRRSTLSVRAGGGGVLCGSPFRAALVLGYWWATNYDSVEGCRLVNGYGHSDGRGLTLRQQLNVVWWFFTKDVPLDKLDEIRAMIAEEPEPEVMNTRVTQLMQMGGVSIPVGG
jgi:hypothetical protein